MRTVRRFKLSKESYEEQRAARRYNPATVVEWVQGRRKRRMTLGAGDSDHLHFFTDDTLFIALSVNYRLDYVGIQVFDTAIDAEVGEVFFDTNLEAAFGRNWEAKSPMFLAKSMFEYIY